MDIQKVYKDAKAVTMLNDLCLKAFSEECNVYFKEMEIDVTYLTPYEAVEVLALLIQTRAYFASLSKRTEMMYCCMEKIRAGIYTGELSSLSAFSGLCYARFIINDLSCKIGGLQSFINNLDKVLAEKIHKYLEVSKSDKYRNWHNFDLINGLSGILRCCLDMELTEEHQNLVKDVIEALLERLRPKKYLGYLISGSHYFPSKKDI